MSSHIFNFIKRNRRKDNLFHSYRHVARINLRTINIHNSNAHTITIIVRRFNPNIPHHTITMQVTMNVSL